MYYVVTKCHFFFFVSASESSTTSQPSTMSSVLPFEIIALIIDIIGENEDTNLLKELALVSSSFLHICSKHFFATIELHDNVQVPKHHGAFLKKKFVKLLENRPDIVKYIRKLTYIVSSIHLPFNPNFDNDHLLSPILPNFLRTIPRLNCLKINGSQLDWNTMDSSLTSAFLHLMHLPTLNHIHLSFIHNFPLSSLTLSANLLRLDIFYVRYFDPVPPEEESIVLSEMMPKIREFNTSESSLLTTKLLHAKMQDGRPAFNFMGLSRLSVSFSRFEDERNIRFLLQNAKLLEKLHLSDKCDWSSVSLYNILSPGACTFKILHLTVPLYSLRSVHLPLGGFCEALEAIAGHNMLETLSLKVKVDDLESEDFIGCIIQRLVDVLVKPGWSALRQISLTLKVCCRLSSDTSARLCLALQSLPDKYLTHLSNLESVAFNYSAYVGD